VLVWVARRGWVVYYGDAEAHLNIARRMVDSRTPGYEQIGTVWLPLPHLLMAPLARHDNLWRSGLAGAVPASAGFVVAGVFFYAALSRALSSRAAAAAGVSLLALNPNLLYLKSTAMTEPLWMAALAALAYFSVRYGQQPGWGAALGAGISALAGTMTRYEGWFVSPFVLLYLLWKGGRRRWAQAAAYGLLAVAGPLYWLGHNWWLHGNVLEFYNGPYSARAIYERSLAQGMARYPGDHDWGQAWIQLREATRLCAGWPLAILGVAGILAGVAGRRWWIWVLLALPVLFYWISLYGAGTPIFVPHLWPHSYYNCRYGLCALPLLAAGAAELAARMPRRFQALAALALVLAGASYWIVHRRAADWIVWKEAQVNSEARRAWTRQAGEFLRRAWRPGEGIVACFGDLAGVFRYAGIPLRYMLHEGNGPYWLAAMARPDLFLGEPWAVVVSGDEVATALLRLERVEPRYYRVKMITVKGGPVIEIYRRAGAPASGSPTVGGRPSMGSP